MSASVTKGSGISIKSMAIQPPSHPTYDLRGIIKLALAEDSADFGINSLFIFCYAIWVYLSLIVIQIASEE